MSKPPREDPREPAGWLQRDADEYRRDRAAKRRRSFLGLALLALAVFILTGAILIGVSHIVVSLADYGRQP